jgi:hypothetical protein
LTDLDYCQPCAGDPDPGDLHVHTCTRYCTDPSCCNPGGYHNPELSTRCPGCGAVDKHCGFIRTNGTVSETPEVICIECWTVYDPEDNHRRAR